MTKLQYGIERLDFRLKDFTRYAWVSQAAKEEWESKINRIINCWLEMEWRSVVSGLRPCALKAVAPQELENFQKEMLAYAIKVEPLRKIGAINQYSSVSETPKEGDSFLYWCVLGREEIVRAYRVAQAENDAIAEGALLGYPSCCASFFKKVWVDARFMDTTWPMAFDTPDKKQPNQHAIEVSGPYQSNILLRWLGPRMVPHLPCSFSCEATVELADRLVDLGVSLGYSEEMQWLKEMHQWPVEWSSLHGIAEIRTPIVKISAATDAAPCKYSVRYQASQYPEAGANGLYFPYRRPAKLKFSNTKAFANGLNQKLSPSWESFSWYYKDNGFSSLSAMDEAHLPILHFMKDALPKQKATVLDLGCGNGILLQKIAQTYPQTTPFGLDIVAENIRHAQQLQTAYATHFVCGDMFKPSIFTQLDVQFDLVALMLGRLAEVDNTAQDFLKNFLKEKARRILVYAYDDYLKTFNSLEALAKLVGVEIEKVEKNTAWAFF